MPSRGTSTEAARRPSAATSGPPQLFSASASTSPTSSVMAVRCMIAGRPISGNSRKKPNNIQIVPAAMSSTLMDGGRELILRPVARAAGLPHS
jgi:hypothetical protein